MTTTSRRDEAGDSDKATARDCRVRVAFRAAARTLGRRSSFRRRVASLTGTQLVSLVLAIAQGVIIARWLGPTGKGELAIAALAAGVMQLVLNPGLSASYVYFTASGRIRVRDLTTHAVAVALLVGIAAPCIVEILRVTGLLHHLIPDVPIGLVLLAAVVLPLSVFLGLMTSILQGQQRISLMNRLSILNSAATLIAVGTFLIVMDMGPPGALLGGAAGNVIAAAVVALALRRDGARFVPALHHTHIKNLVGYGIRAQGGNVVQFTNYRFDQLVLNHVAGPAAVGLYSLAVSLAELLWQLPNAVSTIIFPTRLSRFRQRQILMNTGVV